MLILILTCSTFVAASPINWSSISLINSKHKLGVSMTMYIVYVSNNVAYTIYLKLLIPFIYRWNTKSILEYVSPHCQYINKDNLDPEVLFPRLDVLDSNNNVKDELNVGLSFDSKFNVQMAEKHYSIKMHQSFRVLLNLSPQFCQWNVQIVQRVFPEKWEHYC